MQLRVIKCDGSRELYLHTKVMGPIAGALAECGYLEPGLSEHLAEAVTTFVKKRHGCGEVDADEIHSMIEVVLSDVGCEDAALQLHEFRIDRQVRRGRVMVVPAVEAGVGDDGSADGDGFGAEGGEAWNKSLIVHDLEEHGILARNVARTVAGAVEYKVLHLGCRKVTTGLVRELVLNELLVMREAEAVLRASERGVDEGVAANVM